MGFLMRCKVARLGEPLLAVRIGAHVWFLTGMGSQMRPQIEI